MAMPLESILIPRGSVHTGDGDVVQPQVDAENRSVMDGVVEHEAADHGRAGHRDQWLAAFRQGPRFPHSFVLDVGERLASRDNILIKQVEDFLSGGQLRRLIALAALRCDVPLQLGKRPLNPAGDLRQMIGIPADGVRFGMCLPIQLVLGNPLQHLSRVGHLLFELGQNRIGITHGRLLNYRGFHRSDALKGRVYTNV